jgi:hypothetical protein
VERKFTERKKDTGERMYIKGSKGENRLKKEWQKLKRQHHEVGHCPLSNVGIWMYGKKIVSRFSSLKIKENIQITVFMP